MNIVLKNELYDIKNKYLGFIEQERNLKSKYEESILEKLHVDTRRNDEYYNLPEIQRELYRNNNSIDSEKTKFVERKHNKRLFLIGMVFYVIPSCVGFVLSSFVSFPSIIVPLVSMISCISASGFDCVINHKKCFEKYSKCFEDFDSTGWHNLCGAGHCYLCHQMFGGECSGYEEGPIPDGKDPM